MPAEVTKASSREDDMVVEKQPLPVDNRAGAGIERDVHRVNDKDEGQDEEDAAADKIIPRLHNTSASTSTSSFAAARDLDGEGEGGAGSLAIGGLAPTASHASSVWISQTLSLPREALLVAILCSTQLCMQMGFVGPLVVARTMGASFGVRNDPARLAWLVSGYSLTVGTFILVSGRLGDHFGYRRVLLVGLVWFAVWSVVVGLAALDDGNPGGGWVLVVFARVLQGIGPALCLPNALAILGAAYPPGHRKAMVFAIFGAVAPIGGISGAALASVLALAWWPWAFWGLAIFLAMLGVVGYLIIPDVPVKRTIAPASAGQAQPSRLSRLKTLSAELDLLGAAVGVAALVLFNLSWNMAPINGWGRAEAIAPLVVGAFMFAVFLFVELRVATAPLVPLDALSADVGFVLAAVTCGWATFGVWTLYTMQLVEDTRGLSALTATAWFSPVVVSGAIAAITTGKLLGPWAVPPPVVMTAALAAFTIGITLVATAPADQIYWGQTFVSAVVIPFGMDMSFPAATLILSNAVRKEHQGVAASLVSTVVSYGISLGVGLAGTVEYYVNDGGATREQRLKGYRGGYYMGIGIAGLGLAICFVFLARYYRREHVRASRRDGGDGDEEGGPVESDEKDGDAKMLG